MAPETGVTYGVSRIPGRLLDYPDLTPYAGLCGDGPYISLATSRIMESEIFIRSFGELFGG